MGVAEADTVLGEIGEVLQQGVEAVDGLPVFGAPVDGLAARRGRNLGLGDGGGALSGGGFEIVVLEQHGGKVALTMCQTT